MEFVNHNTAYKWLTTRSDDDSSQFLSTDLPELFLLPESIKSYESLHKFSVDNSEVYFKSNFCLKFFKILNKVKFKTFHFLKRSSGKYSPRHDLIG